ncbi:MAG: zinc ribbon domain-containing protein [Phycisphaeraceae bacterium]
MAYGIKPGRGPSLMGAVVCVIAAIFGIFFGVTATSAGAPPIFLLFGIGFAVVAIGGAIYNVYNTIARNRMSSLDITTPGEEPDPIARALGHDQPPADAHTTTPGSDTPRQYPGAFCPFCGKSVEGKFDYCPHCGKDI